MIPEERDPYLSAAGSFFFPGLGQVYCGRIRRGLVFLVPSVLYTVFQVLLPVLLYWLGVTVPWYASWSNAYSLVYKLVDFAVRGIATYDAFALTKATHSIAKDT